MKLLGISGSDNYQFHMQLYYTIDYILYYMVLVNVHCQM